jgi:hypothetical protein
VENLDRDVVDDYFDELDKLRDEMGLDVTMAEDMEILPGSVRYVGGQNE